MTPLARWLIPIAAVSGALAVGLGAFGAHALRGSLTEARRETFEIAVRYQFYHSLALLAIGILAGRTPPLPWAGPIGALLLGGIVIFSGSLYALVLTDRGWLGAITPIGGVLLILGWLVLAVAGSRVLPGS
ncbi:MAG: DUF423 domain-containing protein [Anaerolineae bacterium]